MSEWFDRISNFLAKWPGLPVMIGIGLVVLNFVFQLLPASWPVIGWMAETNLLLHLGVINGLLGLLIVRVF